MTAADELLIVATELVAAYVNGLGRPDVEGGERDVRVKCYGVSPLSVRVEMFGVSMEALKAALCYLGELAARETGTTNGVASTGG